jgi:magnesium-transporting ATPase (P-type)
MKPEIQAKLQKIKKVSKICRMICKVLLILIAVVGVICVVCITYGAGNINVDNMIFSTAELTLSLRLLLGAVTAVTFGTLFKCIYHLHLLFGNYSLGEIFTRESVGQLRKFGVACLLWGVMSFLWVLSLALTANPMRSFQAHFDSFAIGAIIIVIAWFMDIAVDLREENDLTI